MGVIDRASVLVFGGTAEGRLLVEWLDQRDRCDIVACTATEYGASLLFGGRNVTALQGPLSPEQKSQLVAEHGFCCIVDATHPFATHISHSIAQLGLEHGIDVVRIERETIEDGPWVEVESVEQAADYLASAIGNILLTTGSKDLAVFIERIPDFATRLWVRVLPVPDSIEAARQLGIPTDHILALQGPFSAQLNSAFIREYGIDHLVTKQSGATGGFGEKLEAALECGINLVVVRRPQQETGIYLEEAKRQLEARYGV